MGGIGETMGEGGEEARRPASRERAAEKRVLTQPPAPTATNSREGVREALREGYGDSKPDGIREFFTIDRRGNAHGDYKPQATLRFTMNFRALVSLAPKISRMDPHAAKGRACLEPISRHPR
jgi:hypothetical protein